MSDEAPDDPITATRALLGAAGFILLLIGLELIFMEKEPRYVFGAILSIAGAACFYSFVWWRAVRRFLGVSTAAEREKAERDTPIYDALNFIAFGTWIRKETSGLDAAVGVVSAIGRAEPEMRQAAADGRLIVWGKTSRGGVHVPVPPEFWRHSGLDYGSMWKGDAPEVRTEAKEVGAPDVGRFYHLMTSKAAVEALWPPKR